MYGRPKPTAPARVPPGVAVTAREFAELPFGGHAGEFLGGQAAPAPPPPQPLQIEPPPWAGQEADPTLAVATPATATEERPDALAVMRAEDGDTSWPDPTLPPERYEPLIRPLPPPPDWREEERQRERQRAAEIQTALEPPRSRYPAQKGAGRR